MLKWIVVGAVLYAAFAISLVFAANDYSLIFLPIVPVFYAIEWVRRPPRWRLARAVSSLRAQFAARSPSIVEVRTREWSNEIPTVYLVGATDDDIALIRGQLADFRKEIGEAAALWGVPDSYLRSLRLWPTSRSAIDREGGWFGFDHNASQP